MSRAFPALGKPTSVLPASLTRAALAVVMALGIGARLLQLAAVRPFTGDEAMLLTGLVGRPFTAFAEPLAFGQLAPLGFLMVERLAFTVAGFQEWAFRLVPLGGGLLVLPFTWLAARRLLTDAGALVAVAGVALSPLLLNYSNEAKPYGLDAMFAIAIVWLSLRVDERPEQGRRWLAWGLTCLGAAVLSFPGLLVVGAASVGLLPGAVLDRKVPRLLGWGGAALAVGLLQVLVARTETTVRYMKFYWSPSFLQVSHPGGVVRALGTIATGILSSLPWGEVGPLSLAFMMAAAIGLVRLTRSSPTRAVLLAGPLVGVGLLGFLGEFPAAPRLWLFGAPAVVLCFVAGVEAIVSRGPRRWAAPLILGSALAFARAWSDSTLALTGRSRIPATRSLVRALQDSRAPGEPVYIAARSLAPWLAYTIDWDNAAQRREAWEIVRQRYPFGPWHHNRPWPGPLSAEMERSLTRSAGRGPELFGVASGLVAQYETQVKDADPGWAPAEVARLRALRQACVWVFAVSPFDGEWAALIRELASQGWAERTRHGGNRGHAIRFCRSEPAAGSGPVPGARR